MKKLRFLFLFLLWSLLLVFFVSCGGKTLSRVYVNEEYHAVAEYSDGTTEDLGYVGVEVEKEVVKEVLPPVCTVTFLDAEGNVIKIEKIYRGLPVTPPEAPALPDKAFDGWDAELSSVQRDMTVRPLYVDAAEYTVTFLDEQGNVLDVQTVFHGRPATAPAAPERSDTVFTGWDKDFSAVKSDLTVTAKYKQKGSSVVTFKDYSGLVLGEVTVLDGENAAAPVTPTREGYTFTGWSDGLTNITANKTVMATYRLNEGTNVFDLSYALNRDGTVTLTLSVKGSVRFAGLEGALVLPEGATNVKAENKGCDMINTDNGYLFYTLVGTQDKTEETVLFSLEFTPAADTLVFDPGVADMFDQNDQSVPFTVIGTTVKMK